MFGDLGAHTTHYLLIAAAVIVGLAIAQRVPVLSRVISLMVFAGSLVLLVMLVGQRAQFDPVFGRIARSLNLGGDQQVVGKEMRVPMAQDGHFWVRADIGGVEKRMLVDSGATVTALSSETAAAAGLQPDDAPFPMVVHTANGTIAAQTATVREFRIGNVVARDLPVVVSPAFGDMDVVGMNFVSRLKSWRVEGWTMVLEPHHAQKVTR
ncbi:MAG: TIGR02281 family clan AA aspartic protease [Sphingomonas sp.]